MDHKSDIRLVDPHAKGNGCGHHHGIFLRKTRLIDVPLRCVHTGMIGQCIDAFAAQMFGQIFCLAPRRAIDDAGLFRSGSDEFGDLPFRSVLRLKRQKQVWSVKSAQKLSRFAGKQFGDDFTAGFFIGRRSERCHLNTAQRFTQAADFQIIGPEIMSPLTDAMRLIDGQHIDLQPVQQTEVAIRSGAM